MEEKVKSWKERKAERDAYANFRSKHGFMIKPHLNRPGNEIQTVDGTHYRIAADGSMRRIS